MLLRRALVVFFALLAFALVALRSSTARADAAGDRDAPSGAPAKRRSDKRYVDGAVGILCAGTAGASPSAGVFLGVTTGTGRWSMAVDLRLAGNPLETVLTVPLEILTLSLWHQAYDAPSSLGSLSAGVRRHLTDGDVAPFVGLGAGLDHAGVRVAKRNIRNTGLGIHGELGIDFNRHGAVGVTLLLRADAPAFVMKPTPGAYLPPSTRLPGWQPFGAVVLAARF